MSAFQPCSDGHGSTTSPSMGKSLAFAVAGAAPMLTAAYAIRQSA